MKIWTKIKSWCKDNATVPLRPHNLKDGETCPDCGTDYCRTHEWVQQFAKITGPGVLSVPSSKLVQGCKTRQQINALKKIQIK